MNTWLIDAYRANNKIVLWIKTPNGNKRITRKFNVCIYLDATKKAKQFLEQHAVEYQLIEKRTYLRQWKKVFAVPVPKLNRFEQFVSWIEKKTQWQVPLYDADLKPEQRYLYDHDLIPCTPIRIAKHLYRLPSDQSIPLTKMDLSVVPQSHDNSPLKRIIIDNDILEGNEKTILHTFLKRFTKKDPDVLMMEYAFSRLPYLVKRLEKYSLTCPFHRWDEKPITYRGGKTMYSYGTVRYQDYAIRLRGRFLVDTSSTIGSECDIDAIIELCQLTGAQFQQVASRSFGAVFQSSLVRELVKKDFLVPYKEKPMDAPLSMHHLLKADRTGHTFDPKVGFHKNVAEIDFCSMYPWLIYNYNIGADTILAKKGPFSTVPDVPIRVSTRYQGLVPNAIKPLLDRRMAYKQNPTALNKRRSVGLKYVLVTSYGYLRFREFKLGLASSHMAICAFAREIMMRAAALAEKRGFEIVHGIIDSLYIKKPGMTPDDVRAFCTELEQKVGIPLTYEGTFKWIVFLSSINNIHRPLPARYFGVFDTGSIKARGIEVRERKSPLIVKMFQQKIIEHLGKFSTKKDIRAQAPTLAKLLKSVLRELSTYPAEWLSCRLRISKTQYKNNIAQKRILTQLRQKGVALKPGQIIHFVHSNAGPILPESYHNNPDHQKYKQFLIRAL
jgi:DNA polymerase elongation subunit (family B)